MVSQFFCLLQHACLSLTRRVRTWSRARMQVADHWSISWAVSLLMIQINGPPLASWTVTRYIFSWLKKGRHAATGIFCFVFMSGPHIVRPSRPHKLVLHVMMQHWCDWHLWIKGNLLTYLLTYLPTTRARRWHGARCENPKLLEDRQNRSPPSTNNWMLIFSQGSWRTAWDRHSVRQRVSGQFSLAVVSSAHYLRRMSYFIGA